MFFSKMVALMETYVGTVRACLELNVGGNGEAGIYVSDTETKTKDV